MKCPKCNGEGWYSCDFCWDKKELDWIECIVGVDMIEELIKRYHKESFIQSCFDLNKTGIKHEMSKM